MTRIKEKKRQKYNLGLLLAILSLLAIAGVLISSFIKNDLNQERESRDNPEVLGKQEAVTVKPTPTLPDVNTLVQETFSSAQTVLTEKAVEIKETIIKNVEKEVAKLTQNQIEALKLQICTDWGVVTPKPNE